MGRLRSWVKDRVVRFLTAPVSHYEVHFPNDLGALKRHIRKGDVLLSQGDQRISAVIRYLTQSQWSHAMLYVGDEILRRGGALAERARTLYGPEAEHLLVDALPEGVTFTTLAHYAHYNVRICRPHRLRPEDLETILADAIAAIGWRYDLRNIVHLAWYYLPAEMVPTRFRAPGRQLGSAVRTKVICTSLCGELFDRVGFPVLPRIEHSPGDAAFGPAQGLLPRLLRRSRRASPGIFRRHHPSLLAPRDFDLSPYFEIVKFNVIRDGNFDYQRIRWLEDEEEARPPVEPPARIGASSGKR